MFFHCIFGNDVPIVLGVVNVYVDYCGDHISYRYNTSEEADRRLNRLRAFTDRGAYRINVKPKAVK